MNVTEILIDTSTSMKNAQRLSKAKAILIECIVPSIIGHSIFLRTFNGKNGNPNLNLIKTIPEASKLDIQDALSFVDKTEGNTLISAALLSVIEILQKNKIAIFKNIILVTDGEESGSSKYVQLVEKITQTTDITIHIVGIDLQQNTIQKIEDFSKKTNGNFVDIKSPEVSLNKQRLSNNSRKKLASELSPIQAKLNTPDRAAAIKKIEQSKSIDTTSIFLLDEIKRLRNILSSLEVQNIENEGIEERYAKKIGKESEKYLWSVLKKHYHGRVRWLNQSEESFLPYDFEIVNSDGTTEFFIECKGTVAAGKTFYLTPLEWEHFLDNSDKYQIYRVFYALDKSKTHHTKIDNLFSWIKSGFLVPYSTTNYTVNGKITLTLK